MSNVISLDIHNGNGKRSIIGLIIYEGKFEGFLHYPDDYTNRDIFGLIVDQIREYDAEIVFDGNGFGIILKDYLMEIQNNSMNYLRLAEMKEIPQFIEKAKESILELAIDSFFDNESKVEFIKLSNELNNLVAEVQPNGIIKMTQTNEEIGRSRAMCYLQYYYKYVVNKSL